MLFKNGEVLFEIYGKQDVYHFVDLLCCLWQQPSGKCYF